jgi:biotin carboxylase
MARVLLLATTTGYQTRAFGDAAERLGVELVFATDRCDRIDDPWRDGAIAIRFHEEDRSVEAITDASRHRPIDGLLVVGDRPTVIGARVAEALGLPWHPPHAAEAAKNKLLTRERFRAAGLPTPHFVQLSIDARADSPIAIPQSAIRSPQSAFPRFPCVVKPLSLSGSRGVIRADDDTSLRAAMERLRSLLSSADVRGERDTAHEWMLVEEFIPGREFAVEGLMHHGVLHVLTIFDKPNPLDGPFFEETIYVTPSAAAATEQRAIETAVAAAAAALGLRHGAVHAECRLNAAGVHVLEVAARPIGGLCARTVRFDRRNGSVMTLEELLLRHALGEAPSWKREACASGVMMIPIPRRGTYRSVDGVEAARTVPHVSSVEITAKADQLLIPLPEGASYLGFIFARAGGTADVEAALRAAHAQLRFRIDPEFRVLRGSPAALQS